jgi:hypothetical protein
MSLFLKSARLGDVAKKLDIYLKYLPILTLVYFLDSIKPNLNTRVSIFEKAISLDIGTLICYSWSF